MSVCICMDLNVSIPFISPLKTIKNSVLIYCCDKKLPTLDEDTVELTPEAKLKCQENAIYSKSKKFTILDYMSLSKLEKSVLRQSNQEFKLKAKENIKVGLKVKEKLDNKYGENGYVFVCIGTSPAPLARVLEFTGAETKYIPISHLSQNAEDDKFMEYSDKFPIYGEFLKQQGLSSEAIKKSPKEFLFYDYMYSGRSLGVFRKIAKEFWGLGLPNVSISSADFLCYSSCAKNIDPPDYAVDYVKKYMEKEGAELISGVPHLPIENLETVFDTINYEHDDAKRYNFALIDELNKMGLLKSNRKNKNSL